MKTSDLQRATFLKGWDKRFIELEEIIKELREQIAEHQEIICSLMIQIK